MAEKKKSKSSKSEQKKSVIKTGAVSGKEPSREPQTMDELLAIYESGIKSYSRGEKIVGEVIEMTPKRVVFNIGGKSEGIVAEKAFKEAEAYIRKLKVGDKVETLIIVPENPEGFAVLSLREAARNSVWNRIESASENEIPVSVEVKSVNRSGLMVDIWGLSGFVPKSQIGREYGKNINSLVGKRIEVVPIDINRNERKIVLSEREVSEREEIDLVREAVKDVKEGEVFEGEVSSIYDFGCFVKILIPAGLKRKKGEREKVEIEGLVHISELSWGKVNDVSKEVTVGDKVKVWIIGKTKGKLALSIKQAQSDPWDNVDKKYKKDQKVKSVVARVSDFGLFVSLEPGVEGLIHITKIPPGKNYKKGDEVNVYVETVEKESRKISLGLVLTEKPIGYK